MFFNGSLNEKKKSFWGLLKHCAPNRLATWPTLHWYPANMCRDGKGTEKLINFYLLVLRSQTSAWFWSCPPARQRCLWGAAGEAGAWNPSGRTWSLERRTENPQEQLKHLEEFFHIVNSERMKTCYLHFVISKGLGHLQIDLLTFYPKWQRHLSWFCVSWHNFIFQLRGNRCMHQHIPSLESRNSFPTLSG